MKRISVILTDTDFKKVRRLIIAGIYSTQSEVVRASLRKLKSPNR